MSRRTPLLAAVLSLAAAGLTVGAGVGPAHAASTTSVPSIQVTGPCIGGAGTIAARSYRTSDGGVAVQMRITGVAPGTRWQGISFIGDPSNDPTLTGDEQPPVLTADSNGVVTDSARSEKSWPRLNGAIYFRNNFGAMCDAVTQLKNGRLTAEAGSVAAMLRPAAHAVRVADFGIKKGTKWQVKVAVTGPTGTTRLTRVVTAGEDGYDIRFGNVAHLRGVTRTVVRAVNVVNGKVHWLRVKRSY